MHLPFAVAATTVWEEFQSLGFGWKWPEGDQSRGELCCKRSAEEPTWNRQQSSRERWRVALRESQKPSPCRRFYRHH